MPIFAAAKATFKQVIVSLSIPVRKTELDHMMKNTIKAVQWMIFLIAVMASFNSIIAQPVDGLIAYYSFDACDATDNSGGGTNGIIMGNAQCGCGAQSNGFKFDGNTTIQLLGSTDVLFGDDFTISLFLQPDPQGNSTMNILSKSEACGIDSTVELRYNPVSREISLTLSQQANNSFKSSFILPSDRCYHHVVFVRRDRDVYCYYDGVQQSKIGSTAFVKVLNNGVFTIGGGPCQANGEVRFRGTLDEIRFYNRALTTLEVQELDLPVDKIVSPDTILFTGSSMQVRLPVTCATSIQWSPTTGVSVPNIAEPTITPPASRVYYVTMNYGFCQATDSIRITVADSSALECDQVFFPTGFTPNGDKINDDWGMSNVVFLGEFISLQVYDRWGGEIFKTTSPTERWDGTKKGEEIMPGQYIYYFNYKCEGEEKKKVGAVVLIR